MARKTDKYAVPKNYKFSDEEKKILRPIAETFAMIDGNAFFGIQHEDGTEHYELYLPEAKRLFDSNGGYESFKDTVSWLIDLNHENPTVKDTYDQWRIAKQISR